MCTSVIFCVLLLLLPQKPTAQQLHVSDQRSDRPQNRPVPSEWRRDFGGKNCGRRAAAVLVGPRRSAGRSFWTSSRLDLWRTWAVLGRPCGSMRAAPCTSGRGRGGGLDAGSGRWCGWVVPGGERLVLKRRKRRWKKCKKILFEDQTLVLLSMFKNV